MNDLDQLLHGASDAIADATGPLDERTLTRVRGTVRRARIRRHTAETLGTAACVGVLGAGAWYVAGQDAPDPAPPAHTGTPAPTTAPSPTSTPAPTPEATPTGPVERAAVLDDADVLAHLAAPRTGERWTTPVRDDEVRDSLLTEAAQVDWTVYRVGERGEATLYLGVGYGYVASLLFEVDEDGARAVLCPSARTGDACVPEHARADVVAEAVELDQDTFYDTLTLPERIPAGNGWTFATAETRSAEHVAPYGISEDFGDDHGARTVVDLGRSALVQSDEHRDGAAGLSSHRYLVRLPFGGYRTLEPVDQGDGDFDQIVWDDGVERRANPAGSRAPAAHTCHAEQFSTVGSDLVETWVEAGTTPGGHRVLIPAGSDDELAHAIWQHQFSTSYDYEVEDEDPDYGYELRTIDAFLEAHALWGVPGPDGEWQLRLRSDASAFVYDCL